jgi:uncharacterized protein YecE (DUF72 family)
MTVWIGTSGWSYAHWDGVLYPPGTSPAARLSHYVRRFATVELNARFYRWPRTATFASWRRRLPPGFQLSVKAPRGLTHAKRLYGPEAWIPRITSSWHELGDKRAVFLVQLHPAHERDDARLDHFLGQLPPWMRVAVEFRHPSWHDDGVFALLERHGVAYCVMSGAKLPCVLRATAPFVYVSSTCACTAPTPRRSTPVPTPTRTCAGGPSGWGSGRPRAATCSSTSTTTASATPSATPTPFAH